MAQLVEKKPVMNIIHIKSIINFWVNALEHKNTGVSNEKWFLAKEFQQNTHLETGLIKNL